jgi:glutathione S-transferase
MIIVHHLNNSRSQRVLWLLEELGLEYEVKRYERDAETMLAPPELKKIHPLGKSPVITDNGLTIAESGAITEYLVDKYGHGKLRPAQGSVEEIRYKYWLHYAEGSAMSPLLLSLIFSKIESSPAPFFVKPIIKEVVKKVRTVFINPQLKLHVDYIENELTKHTWFVSNEFSAADIQMSFPLEAARARKVVTFAHPKINAFLDHIHARIGYQHALQKGGPYDLLS